MVRSVAAAVAAQYVVLGAVLASSPAAAQVSPEREAAAGRAGVLDEIIVTARRRDENLQDVPIAVSAFDPGMIENLGIQKLEDIDSFTPGLTIDGGSNASGASFSSGVFIRGIGQSDWMITFEPGVAIYLDGIYFGRVTGNVLDLVDIGTVEVLRGPQGTLFGKNAIGGALNIRSRRPSGDFGGFVTAEGGAYDEANLMGAIEFPLGETLSLRFAGSTRNRDGLGERLTDGADVGDVNRDYLRGTAVWEPNDDLTFTLIADWTSIDEAPRPQKLLAVADWTAADAPPGLFFWNAFIAPNFGDGTRALDSSWLTDNEYDTYAGDPLLSRFESSGAALEAEFELTDTLALTSVTGYRSFEADVWQDYDTTPLPFQGNLTFDEQDQVSQELRLSGKNFDDRLDWVVGVYYFREELEQALFLRFFQGLGFAEVDQQARQVTRSEAAFVHGVWAFSPRWSTSLGLRYTRDEKDFDVTSRAIVTDPNTLPPSMEVEDLGLVLPPGSGGNPTFEDVSAELGLQYNPDDDLMLYASFRQGYKSGGFNNRAAQLIELTPFDNETVNAYEVGLKSEWLERTVVLNLAAFYNDYEDLQIAFTGPAPPVGDPPNLVDNAGAVEIYGIELESLAFIGDHVTLNAAAAWTRNEIKELDQRITTQSLTPITLDNELPRVPEWKIGVGAMWEAPLSRLGVLSVRGDAIYTSEYFSELENFASLVSEEHTIFNARLAFESDSRRWTIYAEGRNLTDERILTAGLDAFEDVGIIAANYSDPRTWRVGFTVRYGAE